MKLTTSCLLTVGAIACLFSQGLQANSGGTQGPSQDTGADLKALEQRPLAERRRAQGAPPHAPRSALAGGPLTLRGEIDGNWSLVEGHVVITYDASALRPSQSSGG